jgi:hypothetical protein
LVDRFGLPWPSNQGYPANKECLNRCFPHISSYIWRQKWDGSKFKPYRDHWFKIFKYMFSNNMY